MFFLMLIACLNLITYVSVKDWKSTMILLLAGLVTYNTQQEIVLFLGILTAALFRSVLIEGLENPTPEKSEPQKKTPKSTPEPSSKPNLSATYIEGLTQQSKDLSNQLSDQQGGLVEMIKQLGPMMEKADKMMNKLPEGFLDAALDKFKNKK